MIKVLKLMSIILQFHISNEPRFCGVYYFASVKTLLKASFNFFFPPVGWGYGILDLGTQVFTGTSITDRVGIYVDNHW